MLEQYSTNYCICQEDSAFFRGSSGCFMGGGFLRFRCPAGGLPFLSPADPAFCFPFCPLSPLPPSPAGKGETKVISCKGLRPLHPRGLNPGGTGEGGEPRTRRGACPRRCRLTLPLWYSQGACLVYHLPTLPFAFLFAPYPPTPFPGGEGGDSRLFHARGSAPCIPGG